MDTNGITFVSFTGQPFLDPWNSFGIPPGIGP
jgi:hypothetical protein